MDNFEILKETKICYEYINDILENSYKSVSDDARKELNKSLKSLSNIYTNIYNEMLKSDEKDKLETNLDCPHCKDKVVISDLIDYAYLCKECDENMYLGEGDLDSAWYFEKKIDKTKLDKTFLLNIKYNDNNKKLYVAADDDPVEDYECNTLGDLSDIIKSYINDCVLKEEYYIKIWENEEDSEEGISFDYLGVYHTPKSAITEAKKIMRRFNYSYLEVLKGAYDELVYGTDGNEEVYRYKGAKIYCVNKDILDTYINNWENYKDLPVKYDLLYSCDNGKYIAVDNSDGNCWVEEFETKIDAFDWLSNYDLKKEMGVNDSELLSY